MVIRWEELNMFNPHMQSLNLICCWNVTHKYYHFDGHTISHLGSWSTGRPGILSSWQSLRYVGKDSGLRAILDCN